MKLDPDKSPLILSFSRGEKGRLNYPQRVFERPLSQPHTLADAATLRCKLAKASLLGERQSEGVFCTFSSQEGAARGAIQ